MILGIFRELASLCLASLSSKEQELLTLVASNGDKTASSLVDSLRWPKSTSWHNLRKLARKSLIKINVGRRISVTKLGKLIFPAVAQLVEHPAVTQKVADSISARGTNVLLGGENDV